MNETGNYEAIAREGRGGLRGRAVKGVLWTSASNWGDQLARLAVFAILARLLEPEAFGLVALAWVFIGLTDVVAEQGLVDALVQRKQVARVHFNTAFWMTVAFGVVLMLVLMGLSLPLAAALDQGSLASVLIALAVVIPIGSFSHVQRALLKRELAFRPLALRTLIGIAVGSVVGIAAALLGFGVWSLVAQRVSTQLTGTLVLWRVVPWRPAFEFGYTEARELFGFGKHVVGFRLMNFVNSNADNFLVGAFLGAVSLGFYVVGYRILRLVIQLTSNLIDGVAFPLYARLQDDPARFRRAYYKSSAFAALLGFPAFTLILVMAPEIVSVLFGPQWSESVPVMQVLAILGIVRSVTYLNSSTLTALGKPSWRVVIVGITMVLELAALLIAVQFGIVAVAVASVCVGLTVAPMSYWAVNRLVPFSIVSYLKGIGGPLVASIVLGAAILGIGYLLRGMPALATLAIATAVGILVYGTTLRIVARSVIDEALELAATALPRRQARRQAVLASEVRVGWSEPAE
jgi:O-antigen/teichoic acid export membrane protein